MNREKISEKATARQHSLAMKAADVATLVERRDISPASFAVWIRQLLQNWRQGTVGVKDRSEVNLTGKKPWKQKGTGRARAGTARSPLWRKGGVTHGPEPRVRRLKIAKKQKSGVLNALFWNFVDNGRILVLPNALEKDRPHTASAYSWLSSAQVDDKKVVLFLHSDDLIHHASFVNMPNVCIVFFDEANAFDLANVECWLVLQKDVEKFKQMVAQWS
jgi:large subunit ribosomal protein L4